MVEIVANTREVYFVWYLLDPDRIKQVRIKQVRIKLFNIKLFIL